MEVKHIRMLIGLYILPELHFVTRYVYCRVVSVDLLQLLENENSRYNCTGIILGLYIFNTSTFGLLRVVTRQSILEFLRCLVYHLSPFNSKGRLLTAHSNVNPRCSLIESDNFYRTKNPSKDSLIGPTHI